LRAAEEGSAPYRFAAVAWAVAAAALAVARVLAPARGIAIVTVAAVLGFVVQGVAAFKRHAPVTPPSAGPYRSAMR
jgi:hypothetical protein